MNVRKCAGVTLVILAAIGLGYFYGARRIPTDSKTDETRALRARVAELEQDNRRYQERLDALQAQRASAEVAVAPRPAATTDPMQRLRVLTELRDKHLYIGRALFLETGGKIAASFAELFALTPAEQQQAQEAVDRARARLADLERAHGTLSREADGSILLTVQAFPAEGGQVYDQLLNDLSQMLGAERYASFQKLALNGLEHSFGQFGTGDRTLTFKRTGERFTVEEQVITRGPSGPISSSGSTRSFATFDQLAAHLGPITSVLPADYH